MSMQRSMQRTMRRTLLAMALVALGANSTALAQSGTETLIDVEGSINNDMGTPSVDVYTFTVNTGDVVTVDIDGPSFDQLDSVLSVVDPTGTKRHENLIQQDTDPADPGSGCTKSSLPTCATYDSYLQFKVDIKGNWTVSVTGNPNAGFGGYNLLVTREEAPLPPGQRVRLAYSRQPGPELTVDGCVQWWRHPDASSPTTGVGIAFTGVSPEQQARIKEIAALE